VISVDFLILSGIMRASHRTPEVSVRPYTGGFFPKMYLSLLSFVLGAVAILLAGVSAATPLVFGPKTYTITAGKPQTFFETVLLDPSLNCDGKAAFVLVMQNGDGNGSNAISSGSVTLNGVIALSEKDFKPGQAPIERPVTLAASNSLGVELKGGHPGNTLTLSIRREIEEPVVGPKDYAQASKTQTFSESFSVPDPASVFTLVVRNGDAAGLHRVKSGSISVNGTTIFGQADLAGDWPLARRRVTLQTNNSLNIDLKSGPGDLVNVSIKRLLDESACGGPRVFFDSPADHATVTTSRILVTGTATGKRDIGITVNGFPAEVDLTPDGTPQNPYHWFSDVAAQPGGVVLHAVAIDAANAKGDATRTITFVPPANTLNIRAVPSSGPAPLAVSFDVSTSFPEQITRYDLDLDGDGVYELSSATVPDAVASTYTTPGIHTINMRATDVNGAITTTSTAVCVQTFSVLNTLLQQRWSQFLTAMSSGSVDAVLAQLADSAARNKYYGPLNLIKPTLSQFAAGLTTIQPIFIHASVAHYLLTRTENGKLMGYHVYFVRDANGVWKVVQF
jgi:hypothetical protein